MAEEEKLPDLTVGQFLEVLKANGGFMDLGGLHVELEGEYDGVTQFTMEIEECKNA